MDKLPPEIVQQILSQVPKPSLGTCRLVCHKFETLSFPLFFSHIPKWLDYETSHRSIISLAHDAYNRPSVMWSPWATGPDGPVEEVWLGIVWKLLMKTEPPSIPLDEGEEIVERGSLLKVQLTGSNFAELSGRQEMTENRLKTGQNRYLLHRSYTQGGKDDAFWSGHSGEVL